MFCARCGANNPEDGSHCVQCGEAMVRPGAAASPAVPPTAIPAPAGPPQTSGMAIASLVLGLLCFIFPASLAAVILGHMARSQIRRSGGRQTGSGMALAGLVLGYTGVALVPLLIVAAIAIPGLLRSRVAANEATAVGCLRTFNTALVTYQASYARGYPPSIRELGPSPAGTAPSPEAAQLIDETLASGQKSGYRFAYTAEDTDGDGKLDAYAISAEPIASGQTGVRYFFTDQTGVIRYEAGSPASAESAPLQ